MRDEHKPFVMYRRSAYNFNIVPRGRKGWVQFGIWLALLVPLLVWFDGFAKQHSGGSAFAAGITAFVGGMLVWTLGGIAWMRARAEIVDVDKLLREKREADRKKHR